MSRDRDPLASPDVHKVREGLLGYCAEHKLERVIRSLPNVSADLQWHELERRVRAHARRAEHAR